MTDLKKNQLYCNHKLKIREYLSKSKSFDIRSNSYGTFIVGKRFCVLLSDENKNIDVVNNGSYITDLFEVQSRLSNEMFIRSTAKLKKNISTNSYYVDKNILRKNNVVVNKSVISIAIHSLDKIKINKIINLHQALYGILEK